MTDTELFLETLRTRKLFQSGASLTIARAPGRLDVMGGIADYSGSLVLERPIAEATFAAVERIERPVVEIVSLGRNPYAAPLDSLADYDEARTHFASSREHHWAAYVAGVFTVLMRERSASFSGGARIVIASRVPEGKGVSSSAALETASLRAVCGAFGIPLDPRDLALLAQKVENLIAGAPCGIMDQMTCVFGEEDSLLALLCQPAELQPPARIPEEIAFWGLDSGERHAVSGSDYISVRTGAFMGRRLLIESEAEFNGYLASLSPAIFDKEFAGRIPEEMSGGDFLKRYPGAIDTVTTVDAARIYRIRQPTAHPIHEHQRVKLFRQLLSEPPDEEKCILLGELMYQSHAGYSRCGLGSPGTDLLVRLVRAQGHENGLYGARITGGGCGGTVAILGRSDAQPAIARIVDEYERATGRRPHIFSGSSPGVARFGAHGVTLRA